MAGLVNVIVVARSRLFREGLQLIISGAKFSANSATASFVQALELLRTGAVQADLIIGSPAPDSKGEFPAITTLRHEFPNAKIVVLTRTAAVLDNKHVLQQGVWGLFSKDLSAEALRHALELVLLGGTVESIARIYPTPSASDPPEPTKRNGSHIGIDSREPADLSGREKQALQCLVSGMSNKLIAKHLGISEQTVKVHLRSLLRKLKVQNRTQAAIWAMARATARARSAIIPALPPISDGAEPRFEVWVQGARAPIEA
jgi:two-component system, NarL family, nitrate/nitrite response regulator NarL